MENNIEKIEIGSLITLERFDGNGIPDKHKVFDIIKTKSNRTFIEIDKGLIYWEAGLVAQLAISYNNFGEVEPYRFVDKSKYCI